jgi:hypothetical protein
MSFAKDIHNVLIDLQILEDNEKDFQRAEDCSKDIDHTLNILGERYFRSNPDQTEAPYSVILVLSDNNVEVMAFVGNADIAYARTIGFCEIVSGILERNLVPADEAHD